MKKLLSNKGKFFFMAMVFTLLSIQAFALPQDKVAKLDEYLGEYRAEEKGVVFTKEGEKLFVQKIGDDGTLWFLSAIDSHKNEHLLHDPTVQLLFKGSDYSDFLSLYGLATLSKDQQKIEELWEPILKTWFTEGKDDPRITVIEVKPIDGYYWDTKHAQIVAFAKQMIGAAIGKTLDDSIEGDLKP